MAVILSGLTVQVKLAVELERLWIKLHQMDKGSIENQKKKLSALREIYAQYEQKGKELYEAFALGEISKDAYFSAKKGIVKKRDTIFAQITELEASLDNTSADVSFKMNLSQPFRNIMG